MGVINDSISRALATIGQAIPSQVIAVEKEAKGVASADADGAVEGGGLGAIAGAEVGAGAAGAGALPGAIIGGLIGLIGGAAIKSIAKALD